MDDDAWRCLTRLLDHARELGILKRVNDEGHFWNDRDVCALTETIGEWNQMIAGFAGQMKDWFDGNVEAAIFDFQNFEHLEAKGRAGK